MARVNAATGERVLGTDGRFYTPIKNPERHKREVAELTKRNNLHRLGEIQDELVAAKEEIKDLKLTLREEMNLNEQLKIENTRMLAQLGATATIGGIGPASKKRKPASKNTIVKKFETAKAFISSVEEDGPAEESNDALIKEARESGKGASVGETAKYEENVTGANAPSGK